MDMRFAVWSIRSMYRTVSLITVLKKLSKYKSYLVGVQEVRWNRFGTKPAGEYIQVFFYGKGNENNELDTFFFFFVHKRIISAVKRAEFVSDRILYIMLRSHWCNIIALNVHAPTKEKIDDMIMKGSFCEELECVPSGRSRPWGLLSL
jgi:hypothetical protein